MISHGKEVKVFAGNSNQALATAICDKLSKKLGNCEVSSFADGEVSLNLGEPVRGADVFIVQSTCKPVNDNLMELLVMIDAMRRASAGRITAVVPYFGYARQDRKAKSRDPISAKLVANMIVAASVQEEINGIINVCTGKPMSLADRVEQFLRDKNYKIKLDYGAFPDRPYDSPGTWGDPTKINRILANDTCKRA